jgi:hypothetical protein
LLLGAGIAGTSPISEVFRLTCGCGGLGAAAVIISRAGSSILSSYCKGVNDDDDGMIVIQRVQAGRNPPPPTRPRPINHTGLFCSHHTLLKLSVSPCVTAPVPPQTTKLASQPSIFVYGNNPPSIEAMCATKTLHPYPGGRLALVAVDRKTGPSWTSVGWFI